MLSFLTSSFFFCLLFCIILFYFNHLARPLISFGGWGQSWKATPQRLSWVEALSPSEAALAPQDLVKKDDLWPLRFWVPGWAHPWGPLSSHKAIQRSTESMLNLCLYLEIENKGKMNLALIQKLHFLNHNGLVQYTMLNNWHVFWEICFRWVPDYTNIVESIVTNQDGYNVTGW